MFKNLFLAAFLFLSLVLPGQSADTLFPDLKFNQVKEVAPGVFFRYSSISATDKNVPFGGSNNIWVVFEDYVAVIDANFPDGAEEVVKAIRKTTNKPIRYVFDTHHHGDHAYGNAVFFKEGATVIAQANCAQLMRVVGPAEFAEAGKGPTGRKDVANSFLKAPSLEFEDRLVLDDGKQRVEFLFLAHGHTSGDAVAWLPKHKILCTGDACVNGAFNFMGHADSASWIVALNKMQDLKPTMICPGHGPVDGPKLVEKQKRYFVDLRSEVEKGLKDGKDLDAISKTIKFPWYEEWTGVPAKPDNIEHVFKEMTGKITPPDLLRDLGLSWGIPPIGKPPTGWKAPRRIIVPKGLMPWRIAELKEIAPAVEFVPVENEAEALRVLSDADAVLGFANTQIIQQGKNLRWVHPQAKLEGDSFLPAAKGKKVQVTSETSAKAPALANQAMEHLLFLAREKKPDELQGNLLLVAGGSELISQIANKAKAFGIRVGSVEKSADTLAQAEFILIAPDTEIDWKALPLKKAQAKANWIFQAPPEITPDQLANHLNKEALVVLDFPGSSRWEKALIQGEFPRERIVRTGEGRAFSQGLAWKLIRENVRRFSVGEPLLGEIK